MTEEAGEHFSCFGNVLFLDLDFGYMDVVTLWIFNKLAILKYLPCFHVYNRSIEMFTLKNARLCNTIQDKNGISA